MKLKILLPTQIFLEARVQKINAEGRNGAFGLLPRHRDFLTTLTSGILNYRTKSGEEHHVAVMEGSLVKKGDEVFVSTRKAVEAPDLESLNEIVEKDFKEIQEKEKKMRSATAQIEAGFIRRFLEFQENA